MDNNPEMTASLKSARSYRSERFLLELDGTSCGFIKSIDGGGITADVIGEKSGPDCFTHKHIGSPKYEDLVIGTDLSLAKSFYDWIAATWNCNFQRKDVDVITVDQNGNSLSRDEYFNTLITETTFPACDASSKEPQYLMVKISPEYSRSKNGAGKIQFNSGKGQQKIWIPSNFRLEIGGLDCSGVSKVDAITVKMTIVENAVGELRDYQREPGKLEFPNLKITIAEAKSETWRDWFDDFVVRGNNSAQNEKNGSLTFLSPNLKDTLAQITFSNTGIFKFARDKVESGSENIRRVQAELYVEHMQLII